MSSSSNHEATPFRRACRIAAVLVWCGVIFAASSRPDLRVSDDDTLDLVLRKAAHVVVFGVLALLVWNVMRRELARSRAWWCVAVAWCFGLAYAISDEWHQSFVHGRVGHAQDVAIDMVGVTLALIAAARLQIARRTPVEATP